MIGTTVSHYRIVGSVGAGAMGHVYLATDERLTKLFHNIPRPELVRESLAWFDKYPDATR